jgi:hypothetical protein
MVGLCIIAILVGLWLFLVIFQAITKDVSDGFVR